MDVSFFTVEAAAAYYTAPRSCNGTKVISGYFTFYMNHNNANVCMEISVFCIT